LPVPPFDALLAFFPGIALVIDLILSTQNQPVAVFRVKKQQINDEKSGSVI
jgi:hypothetical protein